MGAPLKVSAVVPTYNERENVGPLVEALAGLGMAGLSVLFVDDSSPDGTADEVRRTAAGRPWVHLLVRTGRRGFSSAYQEGFREAISKLDPVALVGMDADLQHPPSVIPALVEAVSEGAAVAVASRYVPGGGVEGWSRARRIVSRGANAYSRLLLGLPVRDCTSGFKAFSRPAAEKVVGADLRTKRFEYQVATLKLLKGSKVVEVPYTFVSRRAGRSKLGFWDLPRFFFAVARMRLGPEAVVALNPEPAGQDRNTGDHGRFQS